MALNPGDLLFVGWDSDNDDIAFVATTDLAAGEVIYFTDDEWDGTSFNGGEQYMEWTVPAAGIEAGTVITIDMNRSTRTASIDAGGTFDYMRGGYDIAQGNEMFWAFQGTRNGDFATPTNFIAVIGNEADGNDNQTPNLTNTGLTTSNGAIIIDGDEDYMEFTADGALDSPVVRDDLIAEILDTSNWSTADGPGNNNPNGTGFDVDIPPVVCFVAGTLIETASGQAPVEDLAPGDLVRTLDRGFRPLTWVGRKRVRAAGSVAPVRFDTGALGNTRPLLVSPQHRMLISGWHTELLFGETEILVPAVALVGRPGVTRVAGGWTEYVHILFDRHEIVFAEGVPSESFFLGERAIASLDAEAADEVRRLFPELADGSSATWQASRPVMRARDAAALVTF